ncbi:probable cytochrome P450 6a14 [Zophobas morio]|uniref:probable cytochrome P450 6a14 n=1 Tax=Zophobas morio TaxID=2755281 RepID=UPI003082727F
MAYDSFLGIFIGCTIIAITLVFAYFKWTYQYWSRKNVPQLPPVIPFGSIPSPFNNKEHISLTMKRYYDEMKTKGWKHAGLYTALTPIYYVMDLDYVKNIMAKDFHHFVDRGVYYNEEVDPLSAHLFALGGQRWKNLRSKLTPTFTSGKMKMMFQTLLDCVPSMLAKVESDRLRKVPTDIKEILGCFTTDIIGSCAFGLEFNSFKEDDSTFRQYGRKFFKGSKSRLLHRFFVASFPNVAKKLGVPVVPRDISSFFINVVKETVEYREKNNHTRKDFMQLLIDLKDNKVSSESGYKHDGTSLTMDEIAAQSFVFFIAGFETSSTTMTFALYELATHQDIQNKVRDEINVVLGRFNGEVSYGAIQEMKYMDQVINETLRKYPAAPRLVRKCVKDYKIPDQDVIIEKGTMVEIPVYAIHYDKEYYPDPEKFDPDRFTEGNKSKRHQFAHLPFGEGPRMCIGMRFGLMQSKVGLITLLKNYKFTVNKKTMEPLKIKPTSGVITAEGEIWLSAEKV